MSDHAQLRKELLARAQQLKARAEALAVRLEETAPTAGSCVPPAPPPVVRCAGPSIGRNAVGGAS